MKNRELKFRAWDRKEKQMRYGFTVGEFATTDNCSDFMQFTGLKDRNNKDIYEGDLVKIQDWRHYDRLDKSNFGQKIDDKPMYEFIGRIVWNSEEAKFSCHEIKNNANSDCVWRRLWSKEDPSYSIYPEIIGNIFENPYNE